MKSGERAPFKKKEDAKPQPQRTHGPVINWVGVSSWRKDEQEDDDEREEKREVKIQSVELNYKSQDAHVVTLELPSRKTAEHIYDRVNSGKSIWFRQGRTQYAEYCGMEDPTRRFVRIIVRCDKTKGHEFEPEDLLQAQKIIRGTDR